MDLDYDSLVAAVAAEAPESGLDIDLTDAVLRSGWENVALDTRDGWILRFPRPHVDFAREMAILRTLENRLPVPIPRVEWVGRRRPFAVYRTLTGYTLDPSAYARATDAQRDALAASLAEFLVAMHTALDDDEIRALRVPPIEPDGPDDADPAGASVLLHNDFHFGNLVLDGPVGALCGAWDFSCVATGDPSLELRYFCDGEAPDLPRRIANAYERSAGRSLDLERATVALRVEIISDAYETGTTSELPGLIARWRHEDRLSTT